MNETNLHIMREGCELGVVSVADAKVLLDAGFLHPTDEFWSDADPTPRPLTELSVTPSPERTTWLGRTKTSLAKIGEKVGNRAVETASKISSAARAKKDSVASITDRLLEGYLPQLRQQVARTLQQTVGSAKAALNDEVFLRKLFGAVYDCLPRPVLRFVEEEAFIAFCLKHRQRLLPSDNNSAPPR